MAERAHLSEYGYAESLERSTGRFASFAVAFAFVSIATGTFPTADPGDHLDLRLRAGDPDHRRAADLAMSRDRRFPGWQLWQPIHPSTGTPRNATFFILVVTEIILAVFAERTGVLFKLFSAATLLPAILYLATVVMFAIKRRHLPPTHGFDLGAWETPVLVLALIWLVFEMSIFRDASFKDPWLYIAFMTVVGLIYLGYLLIRHGRRGLDMPDMHSIDAEVSRTAVAK